MSKVLVKLFLLIGLISSITSGSAQNVEQVLDFGDKLFEKGDYFGSIGIYKQALDIDSTNADVLYKYAFNLKMLNNHEKASRYFLKAYLVDRGKTHETLAFDLAESYRNSGDYRKSKRYYTKAIKPYRKDKNSYWYQRITQSKKANTWAGTKGKKSMDWTVSNLNSINSESSEFAGTYFGSEIIYSAMIADSSLENYVILDEDYFAKVYKNKEEIEFQDANKFKGKHLSNLNISNNNRVFFSVCDTSYNCEIWSGKLENDKIKQSKKLNSNINASSSNNTQAQAVNINGQVYLYFVSNREKGFGGLDIWVAKEESFGFDKPINLGSTINSPDNEITPFYNPKNQRLYFSSDWHEGYGGFDVLKAKGGPVHFEGVENLYQPINSTADEYYFFPQQDKALFSSNRKEGNNEDTENCCNDLFEVNYIEDEYVETDPENIEVTVEVLNRYLPLDLFFHNDSPDPNTRSSSTEKNYKNLANQYLYMQSTYEEKYSNQLPDSIQEDGILEIEDFFKNKIEAGLNSLEFFAPLLLKELKKGSNIELTIKGYASSISKSDYNLNLTLRRIESLVNYLKSYEAGVFQPYLNQSASNGGSLKVNKLPFGEFAVETKLDESNRDLAVYSPLAANQRKIEVLAVTQTEDGSVNMDGSATEAKAEISVINKRINLNRAGKLNGNFRLKNEGDGVLKIYTINANCESCIQLEYPMVVQANQDAKIEFKIDRSQIIGKATIVLSVFSNTNPNITELKIVVQ